jgi:hypothetical protein
MFALIAAVRSGTPFANCLHNSLACAAVTRRGLLISNSFARKLLLF